MQYVRGKMGIAPSVFLMGIHSLFGMKLFLLCVGKKKSSSTTYRRITQMSTPQVSLYLIVIKPRLKRINSKLVL